MIFLILCRTHKQADLKVKLISLKWQSEGSKCSKLSPLDLGASTSLL
jgi:hypothetical protein